MAKLKAGQIKVVCACGVRLDVLTADDLTPAPGIDRSGRTYRCGKCARSWPIGDEQRFRMLVTRRATAGGSVLEAGTDF